MNGLILAAMLALLVLTSQGPVVQDGTEGSLGTAEDFVPVSNESDQ